MLLLYGLLYRLYVFVLAAADAVALAAVTVWNAVLADVVKWPAPAASGLWC